MFVVLLLREKVPRGPCARNPESRLRVIPKITCEAFSVQFHAEKEMPMEDRLFDPGTTMVSRVFLGLRYDGFVRGIIQDAPHSIQPARRACVSKRPSSAEPTTENCVANETRCRFSIDPSWEPPSLSTLCSNNILPRPFTRIKSIDIHTWAAVTRATRLAAVETADRRTMVECLILCICCRRSR